MQEFLYVHETILQLRLTLGTFVRQNLARKSELDPENHLQGG